MFKLLFASHLKMIAFFNSPARRRWWYKLVNFHWALNWCPVIVSIRQQVSPILSLAVISLLIDQWGGLLRFKFSVGCKIFDCYDFVKFNHKSNARFAKIQIHIKILHSCLKFGWFYCIWNSHESHARSSVPFFHCFRATSPRSHLSYDSSWRSWFWPSGLAYTWPLIGRSRGGNQTNWARVRFGPVPLASCGNGSGVNSPTAVSFCYSSFSDSLSTKLLPKFHHCVSDFDILGYWIASKSEKAYRY